MRCSIDYEAASIGLKYWPWFKQDGTWMFGTSRTLRIGLSTPLEKRATTGPNRHQVTRQQTLWACPVLDTVLSTVGEGSEVKQNPQFFLSSTNYCRLA